MTWTRKLKTGDAKDKAIETGSMPCVFAWDPVSPTIAYHSSNRKAMYVNFLEPLAVGGGNESTTGGEGTIDSSAEAREALYNMFGVSSRPFH